MRSGLVFSLIGIIVSCDGDDDPTFADPKISISSPADLDGLQALVGSPLTFTLTVEAEAGLSTISVGDDNIKTYTGTETSGTFDYDFIGSENGSVSLIFTIEDAKGKSVSTNSISVEVVGNLGFLIADFGGAEGTSTTLASIDPDHWDASRNIVTFSLTSGLTVQSATHENVGSQFTVEVGADNPDAAASLEFQGKAMKVVKQPASWNTDGWGHIILDFAMNFDQATIEALPQVNSDMTGLTTGTKIVKVDVYFDDTADTGLSFADRKNATGVFNADPTRGYLLDLTLVKHDANRLNPRWCRDVYWISGLCD